jgi:signal transduction histidine kinase
MDRVRAHPRPASDVRAQQRFTQLFASLTVSNIDQMVSEYRALRTSVLKLWVAQHTTLASTDIEDLTRFNEAIDQAVTDSVAHYTKTINHSRELFLGILGHHLRHPIGAVSLAARHMERSGITDPKQAKVVSEILKSAERATRILDDLLDLTRSSFGTDIPLIKANVHRRAV